MTLQEMRRRLARRLGANATSLDSATAALYTDALNEAHQTLLRTPGLATLRRSFLTVASVSGTQSYALPFEGTARIERIWDPTNNRRLEQRDLNWLRTADPNPISGTPWAFIQGGALEAHTLPANASEIFIKSTSASDTNTAYAEVLLSNGTTRSLSVTMTGTTAVSFSASVTTVVQVLKVFLSASAVGTVTVHEDSGSGTELARITIGRVRSHYTRFFLYPTPSAVVTYSLDVLRTVPDLVIDTDEPLVPEMFQPLLLDMAEASLMRKRDDPSRWNLLQRQITTAMRDLQTEVFVQTSAPFETDQPSPEMSRLGAYYPAEVE